jgi:multisubunit Na+/H+ antiporter MnhF subunit
MDVWSWAALALISCQVPLLWSCARSRPLAGLVALQLSSLLVVMTLIALAQATRRGFVADLSLALALLSLPAGLVFARLLERWI